MFIAACLVSSSPVLRGNDRESENVSFDRASCTERSN